MAVAAAAACGGLLGDALWPAGLEALDPMDDHDLPDLSSPDFLEFLAESDLTGPLPLIPDAALPGSPEATSSCAAGSPAFAPAFAPAAQLPPLLAPVVTTALACGGGAALPPAAPAPARRAQRRPRLASRAASTSSSDDSAAACRSGGGSAPGSPLATSSLPASSDASALPAPLASQLSLRSGAARAAARPPRASSAAGAQQGGGGAAAAAPTKQQLAAAKRKAPEVDWRSIDDPAERRRQRRLAKNRITAARSRERKKEQLVDMEERMAGLEAENAQMRALLASLAQENAGLKEQLASLARGAAAAPPCTRSSPEPAVLDSGGAQQLRARSAPAAPAGRPALGRACTSHNGSAMSAAEARALAQQQADSFKLATSSIGGTAESLKRRLKQLDAGVAVLCELKEDLKGKKEFEAYLSKLQTQRADVQDRIEKNRAWIANFEANQDGGAFESQYKRLLEEIQSIYESAKEFHSEGIKLLIKEFGYHLAYKRWNDSFTAVPFTPNAATFAAAAAGQPATPRRVSSRAMLARGSAAGLLHLHAAALLASASCAGLLRSLGAVSRPPAPAPGGAALHTSSGCIGDGGGPHDGAAAGSDAASSAEPQPQLVEQLLSAVHSGRRQQLEARKLEVIREFQRADGDVGSPEVQIALLTEKIRDMAGHFIKHRKDYHSMRGLQGMLNQRRKLLAFLRRSNFARYAFVLHRLGLKDTYAKQERYDKYRVGTRLGAPAEALKRYGNK
ncbi:rpsO [Scenedesmus sp. PABB004]|nr:rpsO [Scenedesmus sp. PABB004]